MAAGLSAILTQYRTVLTAAGLTNLPAVVDIDDLPASKNHKVYRLSIAAKSGRVEPFGGNNVDRIASMRLEAYWDPEVDTEAIWNTVGDDTDTADDAMEKDSNRAFATTGAVQVTAEGWSFEESPNRIKGTATYTVRYRRTVDLS